MRSISLPKSLLVAVLGCIVLSGCGTRNATTDQALAGSGVSAASASQEAPTGEGDPELRFLEMMTRILPSCAQHVPADKGVAPEGVPTGGVPPEPEDLPGREGGPEPEYGPGETPPGVPDADGGIPVPLPDDAASPPEPTPGFALPDPTEEVPLSAGEECFGGEHAQRISEAFKNTKTADYQTMQKKLTDLDYPAAHIHRMPDHEGAPRVRIDLRMMGSRLALEVTGTGSGVSVEAFGAFEGEGVDVADVKRKP
ncbi:hypothetical protein ABZY57_17495 [Streptomyces sp. NPDC006450]|uniref:hypothetical protein n=1 Tax=Streptomyces sp. NPDC006450 TaxID=3155458 RepID=UPI0033B50399